MRCILEAMLTPTLISENLNEEGIAQEDQINQLMELSLSSLGMRNFDESEKYLKQAIKICKCATLYNNLGVIYLVNQSYSKAYQAFLNALDVDKHSIEAFYNLGLLMYYGGKYDTAILLFQDIIKKEGINPLMLINAHNDLGCAYYRKKDFESAKKSFETVLALNEKFDKAHVNIGNILCSQEKHDESIKKYNAAIKINSECAVAYNGIGVAYSEKKDLKKADEFFEKSLKSKEYCRAAEINKIILKKYREKAE